MNKNCQLQGFLAAAQIFVCLPVGVCTSHSTGRQRTDFSSNLACFTVSTCTHCLPKFVWLRVNVCLKNVLIDCACVGLVWVTALTFSICLLNLSACPSADMPVSTPALLHEGQTAGVLACTHMHTPPYSKKCCSSSCFIPNYASSAFSLTYPTNYHLTDPSTIPTIKQFIVTFSLSVYLVFVILEDWIGGNVLLLWSLSRLSPCFRTLIGWSLDSWNYCACSGWKKKS